MNFLFENSLANDFAKFIYDSDDKTDSKDFEMRFNIFINNLQDEKPLGEYKNIYQENFVFFAAENHKPNILSKLLSLEREGEKIFDINDRNVYHETALFKGIVPSDHKKRVEHSQCVMILLKAGVDPMVMADDTYCKKTALDYMIMNCDASGQGSVVYYGQLTKQQGFGWISKTNLLC
jgi:hypothetical protein